MDRKWTWCRELVKSCYLVFCVLQAISINRMALACGPTTSSPFPIAKVLETEEKGYVLLNITREDGVTWSIASGDGTGPSLSGVNRWLNNVIAVRNDTSPEYVQLVLNDKLDLEFIYVELGEKKNTFQFQLTCTSADSGTSTNFEYFVVAIEVNEFAPEFVRDPFELSVPENSNINEVLITLRNNATDKDVVISSDSDIHEFDMEYDTPWDTDQSHKGLLKMDNKQNGEVAIAISPDFESFPSKDQAYVIYNITVYDMARWNASSNITLHIIDVDDQPPEFFYPECASPCTIAIYSCWVAHNFTGLVTTMMAGDVEADIKAKDGDALNYNIKFRIKSGPQRPRYREYVEMDANTGHITVIKEMSEYIKSEPAILKFEIEAYEIVPNTGGVEGRSTTKALTITVRPASEAVVSTKAPAPAPGVGKASTDTIMIAVIVLSIVVVLSCVVMAFAIVYIKKRPEKPIYPIEDDDDAGSDDTPVVAVRSKPLERGDSNTDSGQWSNNGAPSPGPHARGAAPDQTQLTRGHPRGPRGANRGKRRPHTANASMRNVEGQQMSAGYRSGRASVNEVDAEEYEGAGEYDQATMDQMYHMMQMMQGMPGMEEMVDEEGNPVYPQPVVRGNSLPPLRRPAPKSAPAGGKGAKKPRAPKKQRREQSVEKLKSLVFDGTKVYPTEPHPEFFTEGDKAKVKLSTRKRKRNLLQLDPKYWMTVENDYTDI